MKRDNGFGLVRKEGFNYRQHIFDKKGESKAVSEKRYFRSGDFKELLLIILLFL